MERDESRLPKWAQSELRNLRQRVTELEAKADRGALGMDYGPDALHLEIQSGIVDFVPSRWRQAQFLLDRMHWDSFIRFKRTEYNKRPMVEVHSGYSHLIVLPRCGNVILLDISR